MNKAPASFDPKKLWSFEERHFQALPLEKKVELAMPFLERTGLISSPLGEASVNKVRAVVAAAGDRLKVAGDILQFDEFFLPDDGIVYEEKSFKKYIHNFGDPFPPILLLETFKSLLSDTNPFDAPTLEKLMHDLVADKHIKIGQIIHPVRVAVTGKSTGLSMFDTLAILGKPSCIARINRALKMI